MGKIKASNDVGYVAPIGLAADAVVFTIENKALSVLLVKRPEDEKLALPGGFVGEDENPSNTVARKLVEKTGVESPYFEQLATYADPARDPRGWLPSVAYLALLPASALPPQETTDASWYPVNTDADLLAFDHAQIIQDGVERLRGKLWYSNIARALLPEKFTLSEALEVYQTISGREYPAGNFSRDIRRTGLLEPCDANRAGGRGRPAELYRFVSQEFSWNRKIK